MNAGGAGENDREVVRMLGCYRVVIAQLRVILHRGPRRKRLSHQVQGKLLAGKKAESLASLGENRSFPGRIVGFTPEIN